MSVALELRPARPHEASAIASMSRDLIETGLGWSWRATRVQAAIRSADNLALVAVAGGKVLGFGIMHFGVDEARLNLLAVRAHAQRAGLGTRILAWLETSALTAGLSVVYLEVRANRPGAQRFYRRHGYRTAATLRGYYLGREDALLMAHDLWRSVPYRQSEAHVAPSAAWLQFLTAVPGA